MNYWGINSMPLHLHAVVITMPPEFDHDDVRWEDDLGMSHGFGYRGKGDGEIHVTVCQVCSNENYLSQSICIFCGFDPNKNL
jgi:hypothetical protein